MSRESAISQLEHVKKWIVRYLKDRPFDPEIWSSWDSWVDWNVDEIQHAIDHAISDLG